MRFGAAGRTRTRSNSQVDSNRDRRAVPTTKLDFSHGPLIACPPCDLQTAVSAVSLDRRTADKTTRARVLSRIIFRLRRGAHELTIRAARATLPPRASRRKILPLNPSSDAADETIPEQLFPTACYRLPRENTIFVAVSRVSLSRAYASIREMTTMGISHLASFFPHFPVDEQNI